MPFTFWSFMKITNLDNKTENLRACEALILVHYLIAFFFLSVDSFPLISHLLVSLTPL